jgi:hypothetical protein
MYVDRHNSDHVCVAPCCQAVSKVEKVADFEIIEFNPGKINPNIGKLLVS